MRAIQRSVVSLCLIGATSAAGAQERKPGLYDVTFTTTTVSPSPAVYPPRTMQVCLTQQMIDKFGAIVPDNLTHICQLANVDKKPGGMTADLVCSGPLTGKGTLEVNWTDGEHTKGNIHFSGSMHPGDKEIKIEWSTATSSVYKSPDCAAPKTTVPVPAPPPAATPTPPTP
jgi:Protein of unknown function (DUF3617)